MFPAKGEPARVVLVSAGDRGKTYARWIAAHPETLRLVAVADPNPARREEIALRHGLTEERCFSDWRELLETGPRAEAAIVATPDRLHREPAEEFLRRGYHLLLEKPAERSEEGLESIGRLAAEARGRGGSLTVCHVLRYSPLFRAVRDIVASGRLGRIVSYYHAENVSRHHFAHSYVRGNWGVSGDSSPLILAKSSHDLDLILWISGLAPTGLSAAASQSVFIPSRAPDGAPRRCSDGCPAAHLCPYEARRTYLHGIPMKEAIAASGGLPGEAARLMLRWPRISAALPFLRRYRFWREWPTSTITDDSSPHGIERALIEGPYGRCVYRCGSDQPERHETVIEFDSGAAALFRLHGMSDREGRTLRIDGTGGTLHARFGGKSEIRLSLTGEPERRISFPAERFGHASADRGLMECWSGVCRGETPPPEPDEFLMSHRLALLSRRAAEEGRRVRVDE